MPTGIDYVDETWNVVTGCTPVHIGCVNCWAKRAHKRLAANPATPGYHHPWEQVTIHPELLEMPSHWRKPRRILVSAMGDLFHEQVPQTFVSEVLLVASGLVHQFMLLTKRPARMRDVACSLGHMTHDSAADRSLWWGVSASDQETLDAAVPHLDAIAAAGGRTWLSLEPLLGPVTLSAWLTGDPTRKWVVVGGETGPGARHCAVEWIARVMEQCRDAGIPVWLKQFGQNDDYDGGRERKIVAGGDIHQHPPFEGVPDGHS